MSERNWFIKFNLDDMSHDLDTLETDAEIAEWVRGFKRGARGEAPTTQTGARLKGNLFGFQACQEADRYRASRAANRAKGHEKKKGLQTSKEEISSIQHPASSIHETRTHDPTHDPTYDPTYVANTPPAGLGTGASASNAEPMPCGMPCGNAKGEGEGEGKEKEKDNAIGAAAPSPADRRPYDRFEKQYQTPKPAPVVLPFEETPEGKACLASRARIRAMRLAKEQQSA